MDKYNDSELLYLICNGSEEACAILFNKYKPLIYKRIRSFKIKKEYIDDFYQEGLIALHNAAKSYDPKFGKQFVTFFDLVLQRRFQTLLEANKKRFYLEILFPGEEMLREDGTTYLDPILSAIEERPTVDDVDTSVLSKWEEQVFILRFKEMLECKEIAKITNQDTKNIYNALYNIKKKLRNQFRK